MMRLALENLQVNHVLSIHFDNAPRVRHANRVIKCSYADSLDSREGTKQLKQASIQPTYHLNNAT